MNLLREIKTSAPQIIKLYGKMPNYRPQFNTEKTVLIKALQLQCNPTNNMMNAWPQEISQNTLSQNGLWTQLMADAGSYSTGFMANQHSKREYFSL